MSNATLERDGEVFILNFGGDENVTTDAWVVRMDELLDEVAAAAAPAALITTGSAKHYSNGLDVPYMSSVDSAEVVAYVGRVLTVVERIMLLGVPTVAAVNGHAFGMGAFLVVAHDVAVMREDRGYFCFPEVHLGMSFPPRLMDVAKAVLRPETLRPAMAAGNRYGAGEAVTAGIVDAAVSQDELLDEALARARAVAPTAGPTLATIKAQLFPQIVANHTT